MKIDKSSIVDTIINYAKVKFGVDIGEESVSNDLKSLSFAQTLKLVDAIQQEDDDAFAEYIDLSAVNEELDEIEAAIDDAVEEAYGNATTATPSRATARDAQGTVAARRATISAQDAARDATGSQRTVAGGNKTATGSASRPAPDMDGQQRQANAQTAGQAQAMAAQNAQEIERLKALSGIRK